MEQDKEGSEEEAEDVINNLILRLGQNPSGSHLGGRQFRV